MVSAFSNHSCSNFTERVELYLDGALDKQQERVLLTELRSCPTCLEKFSKEQAFRNFIKHKVSRKKVSPEFVQSIKDKIRFSQP
jgi:hypothetical protein